MAEQEGRVSPDNQDFIAAHTGKVQDFDTAPLRPIIDVPDFLVATGHAPDTLDKRNTSVPDPVSRTTVFGPDVPDFIDSNPEVNHSAPQAGSAPAATGSG